MEPTTEEVVATLLRMLYQKGVLTAEDVAYITMYSPDWEEEVYERDHDTQELIK